MNRNNWIRGEKRVKLELTLQSCLDQVEGFIRGARNIERKPPILMHVSEDTFSTLFRQSTGVIWNKEIDPRMMSLCNVNTIIDKELMDNDLIFIFSDTRRQALKLNEAK